MEDALPILLRGWGGTYLKPEDNRKIVSFLPSLLQARLERKPLAWTKASIARSRSATTVSVPAGRFAVTTWTVVVEDGRTLTYQFEAEPPYRFVRWAADTGEEAQLLGSTRLAYWELDKPGGEKQLKELGLVAADVVRAPPAPPTEGSQIGRGVLLPRKGKGRRRR
jgi:hypothetical protein